MMPLPGYYWPPNVPRDYSPESLRLAFESVGYEICIGGHQEVGFDKVALYVDTTGEWSHAAKQQAAGDWGSKVGKAEDIRHNSEHCFGDSIYGEVIYYMKRPTPQAER